MKILFRCAAAWLLAAPLIAAASGSAHQHGVGTLDIAVDARRIVVQFDTPLDNLVGFERAPRTDAERKRADEAVARLKDGDQLFRFDAAAGCKLARASLDSPVLGLGSHDAATAQRGHADLHASWEFDCADAAKATQVEVGLFAFRQLKRVQVQLALPKAQLKRELKRPNGRLSLGP
ncbi:MAG TPA: DUF2796 domain-containing protein [Rubrivivax sp.]|nr:DUF2796 domain-containing protein [Rubrivivax sp.]